MGILIYFCMDILAKNKRKLVLVHVEDYLTRTIRRIAWGSQDHNIATRLFAQGSSGKKLHPVTKGYTGQ